MSAATRSRPGDAQASSRSTSGAPDNSNSFKRASSVHDALKDSFVRGLKDIFESFVARPDFHALYERDLSLRLYRPWHRVGNAMRLALGEPVTLTVMGPDGTRTTHRVEAKFPDDAWRTAIRQARHAIRDSGEDVPEDHATILLTRKQSEDLAPHVRRK